MNTQEKKNKITELINELGVEGIGVEVESQSFFNVTKNNIVTHTITFKEIAQC